jgi:hypothetical protein
MGNRDGRRLVQEELMMRTKHTPGPWSFACDSYGKVQHSRKYDCVYANVKGENGDCLVSIAARIENQKDACLIAAAPTLLEACLAAYEVMPDSCDERFGDCEAERFGRANQKLRAAIAKATGEE